MLLWEETELQVTSSFYGFIFFFVGGHFLGQNLLQTFHLTPSHHTSSTAVPASAKNWWTEVSGSRENFNLMSREERIFLFKFACRKFCSLIFTRFPGMTVLIASETCWILYFCSWWIRVPFVTSEMFHWMKWMEELVYHGWMILDEQELFRKEVLLRSA